MVLSPLLVVALVWITFGKLVTVPILELQHRRTADRAIIAGPIDAAQRRRELWSLPLVVVDGALLTAGIVWGWLALSDESLVRFAVTLGSLFIWVEIWFYASHVALHRSRVLWRIHRHHHLSQRTSPLSSASFSVSEKLFVYSLPWVGFLMVSSQVFPVSMLAITAYYTYYQFASPVAHSNREVIQPWFRRLPFLGRISTITAHSLHHACADTNFGFFTTTLDRWFGTANPQNERIYQRTLRGEPPTRLPDLRL
jgi:lathosterol oxidase